ncbi:MAG: UDP-N-acetylmuramoyl-L-alanine--D-glutamate ligase [Bacteroidetes bacterium]|nr:UDP-N-acetylmuramoyl-L-alanine--D-glutamate ligase [Bacteroidota bacterium]
MNKKLVILGASESGCGAALLGVRQGYDVFVSDAGIIKEQYLHELEALGVPYESGTHSIERILQAIEIIKSPGIPDKAAIVVAAREAGIPVISEIEFAGRYTDALKIIISGTNGKTTTTALTYHILKEAGLNVGCAGNIGDSFARMVATRQHDIYVLEVSSFQLDGMFDFHAHISVLTNITPDHLDRYDYDVAKYAASKFRLANNQTAQDYFIYCADDPLTLEYMRQQRINSKLLPFSINSEFEYGAWAKEGSIHVKTNENPPFTMTIHEMSLRGIHNTYNSMASAVVAGLLDIRKEKIRESLANFQNIEHRLEFAGRIKGVEYINDSKATNVNSAWYALESMERPVVWIAGGVDKGNDYEALRPLVREKVRVIVALGVDNRKIHEAFQKDVDMIVNTGSMEEAVHVASGLANRGDIVLLSPACASFDLFHNYEERGRLFKDAVRNL